MPLMVSLGEGGLDQDKSRHAFVKGIVAVTGRRPGCRINNVAAEMRESPSRLVVLEDMA